MMFNQQLVNEVKRILAQTIDHLSSDKITSQSKLRDDLGLDSMTSLTFLMALEDNIQGFVVDPETLDAKDMEDVESICRYVEKQLNRKFDHVA